VRTFIVCNFKNIWFVAYFFANHQSHISQADWVLKPAQTSVTYQSHCSLIIELNDTYLQVEV